MPSKHVTLERLLRLAGLGVVLVLYLGAGGRATHSWLDIALAASVLGWVIWALAPNGADRLEQPGLLVMALGGGLASVQVGAAMIAALVAIFAAVAQLRYRFVFGLGVTGAAAACAGISAAIMRPSPAALLGQLAAFFVVFSMGWSRRQFQVVAEQNHVLVEQSRLIRAERDRAAAASERSRIARDMHDVLAHTLGGLVLQLDAADALLEAGETDSAAARVKASHQLAVSGLADARRVVDAQRADRVDLHAELEALAEHHRLTAGQLNLTLSGDTTGIDEQILVAIARAAQEVLSNARQHAHGSPVRLDVHAGADRVELDAENRLSARRRMRTAGGGWGLLGIRERVAAVGGSVTAGKEGERWRVRIIVPLN